MEYITDVIGGEYQKWCNGDLVLITAPTGCGKSYFILHVLLKHAIRNNKRILYFVNRKILKSQLDEEIMTSIQTELFQEYQKVVQVENYIKVMTYQSIETKLKSGGIQEIINYQQWYDYVVYDEQCVGRSRLLRKNAKVYLFSSFPCEQAEINTIDYMKEKIASVSEDTPAEK